MDYLCHTFNLTVIYIVLALSLNLILGFGGMVSMAHAVFFCVGGYISAIVTMKLGGGFLAGLAVATLSTGIMGGMLAAPFIRVREEYLILFTLAFQMVVYNLMLSLHQVTGGDSGIFGVPPLRIFGIVASTPLGSMPFMIVFLAVVLYICRTITASPFGRVLKGLREDQDAVKSLGKNVIRFKVLVFMVGAGIAAAAGSIFAHYTRFINPSIGSLDESILLIAMVVLGGTANLLGSVVGAILLVVLPQALNFLPGASDLIIPLRGLIYGVLLILFMRFRPEGLVPEHFAFRKGLGFSSKKDLEGTIGPDFPGGPVPDSVPSGPILEVKGLYKSFGGLKAVDDLSFSLDAGRITALVGPNGCGKTTAFNMITGFLKPDRGEIRYAGKQVTNLPPYKLPRMGIARSWQDVRIFQGMTVLDNVLVARQGQEGEAINRLLFTPWRVRRQHRDHRKDAFLYLSKVGLRDRAWEVARNLSYAEQKLLAMARLLSTEAEVLLLDEPSSGVDPNWVKRFMQMIDELSESGKTICIVEHNLEVVKEISDIVYFMVEGNKAAEGTAEELMSDPKLGEIYFGL